MHHLNPVTQPMKVASVKPDNYLLSGADRAGMDMITNDMHIMRLFHFEHTLKILHIQCFTALIIFSR